MKIIYFILITYPLWGIPALILFNFFYTRYLIANHSLMTSAGLSLLVSLLIFTPLIVRPQSFFSKIYSPWYLAPLMGPPGAEFDISGFFATIGLSIATIGFTLLKKKY